MSIRGTNVSLCVPEVGAARMLSRIIPTLQRRDLRLRGTQPVCESGGLVLECILLILGHTDPQRCVL